MFTRDNTTSLEEQLHAPKSPTYPSCNLKKLSTVTGFYQKAWGWKIQIHRVNHNHPQGRQKRLQRVKRLSPASSVCQKPHQAHRRSTKWYVSD